MLRPLGPLSDFVVEVLPIALAENSQNLTKRAHDVVSATPRRFVDASYDHPQDRWLALLDMKMLDAALAHTKRETPLGIYPLIDFFAGDQTHKGLTYEELVLINPRQDPRAFSTGEVRTTEVFFYDQHRITEEFCDRMLLPTWKLLNALDAKLSPEEIDVLADIPEWQQNLHGMIAPILALQRMNAKHFDAFRPYFNPRPHLEGKGASGAFSAGHPLLEFLWHGDLLNEKRLEYVRSNWQYFPRRSRRDLTEALNRARSGRTVHALAPIQCTKLQSLLGILSSAYETWRAVHITALKKQLPDTYKYDGPGTSEPQARSFLEGRMRNPPKAL